MTDGAQADAPAVSLFVDEIGIEIGVYGDFRLQSSYAPVFARREDVLKPVAVQGALTPFRSGERVSLQLFIGAVAPQHRLLVAILGSLLHVRNFHHICADWLDLLVDGALPAGDGAGLLNAFDLAVPQGCEDAGICAEQVILGLRGIEQIPQDVVLEACNAWKARGLRLLLDEPEIDHGMITRIMPEFIRLDPNWFGERIRTPEAARLVGAAVRGMQAGGTKVLAPAIDNRRRLAAALAAGVDLLQGEFLGSSSLVGVDFDDRSLAIADLLTDDGGAVLPFERMATARR